MAIDSGSPFQHRVGEEEIDVRLDHWLASQFPDHSRSRWQKAVQSGGVTINGESSKPSHKLQLGDEIAGGFPEPISNEIPPAPQIDLSILYEDEQLVVLDKPAQLIVHPGKANYGGTLANALVHHFTTLSKFGGEHRPGIVHRLDRDTTGVIIVARDDQTHEALSAQFADRTVEKEYRAIVWGNIEFDADYIETHIRAHSKHREKMIVCGPDPEAREAITYFEVLERFGLFTYVKLLPKTGRTHQLRVHMQHLHHPIVADRIYGGQPQLSLSQLVASKEHFEHDEVLITRQALHAHRLCITHPHTGKRMEFVAPLPPDMQRTLDAMRSETDA